MRHPVLSRWRATAVIACSSFWLVTCAQAPPVQPEKTPLERALEAATSGRQATGDASAAPAQPGQGKKEEVSEAAANSLAQVLVEAEKEQHPLALYFLPKAEQGNYVDWAAD
jgi:hypothetical protein